MAVPMYAVKFVADGDLPDGHAWAMAHDADGNVFAFIKHTCLTPRVLEEAWAAYRQIAQRFSLVA